MPKGYTNKPRGHKNLAPHKDLIVHRGNGQKRNNIQSESDKWLAVRLYAQGQTYGEIAKHLNETNPEYDLSGEQVRLDITSTMVEWKRQNMENVEAYIAKELIRLDQIEEIVKNDYKVSQKALRPGEYAVLLKRGMTIEEIDELYSDRPLAGDPKFLDTLLRVQMQRMRLLGIEKGSDVPKQTVVNYQFNNIGDEALAKMADLLQDNKYEEFDDQ